MQSTSNYPKHHPIVFQSNKNNLTPIDLCKILGITKNTLKAYIKNPGLIRFEHMMVMSGLFGLPVEELVYLILRNKPQLKRDDKWYLEELRNKHL